MVPESSPRPSSRRRPSRPTRHQCRILGLRFSGLGSLSLLSLLSRLPAEGRLLTDHVLLQGETMDRRSKDHLTTTVTNIRDYQTRKVSYTVGGLITPFQSSQRALAVRGSQASRDGTSPPPAQGRALTLSRTVKARAAHLWEPVMAVLSLTCSNARIVTSTLPSCSIISIARARQHLRRLHRLHPTSTTGLRWPYHWHLKQPTNHTMYDNL